MSRSVISDAAAAVLGEQVMTAGSRQVSFAFGIPYGSILEEIDQ
jgi:hypothetical protein